MFKNSMHFNFPLERDNYRRQTHFHEHTPRAQDQRPFRHRKPYNEGYVRLWKEIPQKGALTFSREFRGHRKRTWYSRKYWAADPNLQMEEDTRAAHTYHLTPSGPRRTKSQPTKL